MPGPLAHRQVPRDRRRGLAGGISTLKLFAAIPPRAAGPAADERAAAGAASQRPRPSVAQGAACRQRAEPRSGRARPAMALTKVPRPARGAPAQRAGQRPSGRLNRQRPGGPAATATRAAHGAAGRLHQGTQCRHPASAAMGEARGIRQCRGSSSPPMAGSYVTGTAINVDGGMFAGGVKHGGWFGRCLCTVSYRKTLPHRAICAHGSR